jgi:uncharacterized protein YuzE
MHYDSKSDVLYLVYKKGPIEETMEAAPGVNLEFTRGKELVGIEFFDASRLFKPALKPMELVLKK